MRGPEIEDVAQPLTRTFLGVPAVSLAWTLVAVPTLLGLILNRPVPEGQELAVAFTGTYQLTMLACAVAFAARHRLFRSVPAGWMAVGLCVLPVVQSVTALVALALPPSAAATASSSAAVIGGGAALVCFTCTARQHGPRHEPITLGFAAGVLLSGGALVSTLLLTIRPVAPAAVSAILVDLAGVALVVAAIWAVARYVDLPGPIKVVFLVGGAALGARAAILTWGTARDAATLVPVVLDGVACVAFLVTAMVLLSMVSKALRVGNSLESSRMDAAERDLRTAEAVLHEARSTMAGLSSAAQLLDLRRNDLSEPDRIRLVAMSTSEMERMQRLLDGYQHDVCLPVSLTDVIGPLIESLRSRGHAVTLVHAQLTPCQALARADDVAEVVHILLDNAARHGSGSAIVVGIVANRSSVQITVVDDGPGVPQELRETLFDWGISRPGSVGRGIGLHVALARAQGMGGNLRLASSAPGHTSFELILPGVVAECA